MNSSRSACYLYKNKFIILISLLPKAYIVCHDAQNNLYFLALVLACRGNSTAISQSVWKSQMWIVIVKIETDDRSSHTFCIVSAHIFMLMDRRFHIFFLASFLASSRRQCEKFANINSHEIKFMFIFPSLDSQCFFRKLFLLVVCNNFSSFRMLIHIQHESDNNENNTFMTI